MPPALIALLAAGGWFAVFVCLQVAALRAGLRGTKALLLPYAVATLGMVATVAIAIATTSLALALIVALLASACLFVLYVPALYTVLASLSVQSMVLLARSGGALPESELYNRFAGRELFQARLHTLTESGYVVRNGGYRLTSRGQALARPFAALKRLWRLGSGG